jgi:hypothetical protein
MQNKQLGVADSVYQMLAQILLDSCETRVLLCVQVWHLLDSTAAGNAEMSATLTVDHKECNTFSAATSLKRKTTDAKNRDHDNCHTLVRTALLVTSCQQVYLVSKPSSWHCCFTFRESRVQMSAQRPIFLI